MTAPLDPEDARIDDTTRSSDAAAEPSAEPKAEPKKPARAPRKAASSPGAAAAKTAAVKKAAATSAASKSAAAKKAAEADAGRAAAVKKASTTGAAAKTASRTTAARTTATKTAAAKRAETAKKAQTAAAAAAKKSAPADPVVAEQEGALEESAAAPAKSTAAKSTAAKTTATKTTAAKAKSAAAKSTAAKATAAKTTSAAKTSATTPSTAASPTKASTSTSSSGAAPASTAKPPVTKARAKTASASTPRTDGAVADSAPPVPEITSDAVIALDAEPVRRLVAASNSAELAEARPPRRGEAGSAVVVEPGDQAPTTPAPDASAADSAATESATPDEVISSADADADPAIADSAIADPAVADPAVADSAVADPAVADLVVADPDGDAPAGEAIRIRGLVKRFGDSVAVDDVDLTVPAGSFYGLVGPNGAGKTTTLSIIAGLLRPDAGTVHISGIDQREKPLEAKRVMGVLPDRLRTFDRLTGRQLLYYYGQLRGLDRAVIEKRTADLARAFDLSEALSRVVSDYSAGMTKKVMLAGALIHSPRVLVLDEPFEAVDPVSSGVILDILRSYVAHGGTVILSSHGMDLVERVCSRVAVIVGGEVLAEGTIDEVRAGQTLTQRFIELSGTGGEVEGLEWLHTFSA
ncbi:ATP-binding cassette domain-containing protein [Microbacterium sp.]|uniref:ATP-binding cassette domain-containing protein n=1 Tax=Microbacterium sp. TaxID=51671 RepID=UPI0028B22C6E|nr:ATP-binding cassette domain-containing protein [Microbacterium sp.]